MCTIVIFLKFLSRKSQFTLICDSTVRKMRMGAKNSVTFRALPAAGDIISHTMEQFQVTAHVMKFFYKSFHIFFCTTS